MRIAKIIAIVLSVSFTTSSFASDHADKAKDFGRGKKETAAHEQKNNVMAAKDIDAPKAMPRLVDKKTKFGAVGRHGQTEMLRSRTPSK